MSEDAKAIIIAIGSWINDYNCTPNSGLTAFDTMSLDDAIKRTLRNFPKKVETAGMYG